MPHTLLLADDSVTIQRVIELTFADEDVHVLTVGDGDQAIAAIDQKPPDIVLADVGMPGRDGYEVAQHVKKTPRLAHIPVLLLTGAFEPVDQVRASAVGCDGVLAKPFEPQLVIGRVKELLGRQPAAAVAAVSGPVTPQAAEPALDELSQAAAKPHRLVNDEYFDELDQAFATLTASAKRRRERTAEPASDAAIGWFSKTPGPAPTTERPPAADDPALDAWTVALPKPAAATPQFAPPPPAAPDSNAPPPAPEGANESRPVSVGPPARVAAAPLAPSVSAFPKLADAFAALLAAEQTSPPAAAPIWPSAAAPAPVSREVVEEATRRILQEMSQSAVRDIVTEVAERLVREEIERIRKTIT